MRERILATGIALGLAIVLALGASAQIPYIAVYFDPGFSLITKDCPGEGLADVWYVAGVGFNTLVTGAEFAIEYPPAVLWVSDLNTPPVTIGSTPQGISMGYSTPLNGYAPVGLCQVQVEWVCDGCAPPFADNLVNVLTHPHTNFLGWTDQEFTEWPAMGWTSMICVSTPTEETTWGRVKALFGE